MEALDIKLLGKDYQVACPADQRETLLASASFLNDRLNEVAARTQAGGEKLAMMTALNLAHEFLTYQNSGGVDISAAKRRLNNVSAKLDTLLSQQDRLF